VRRIGGVCVALLLGSLVAGCGSSHSERPEVAGYIGQLNRIESAATAPLQAVTQAGNRFSTEEASGPAANGAPDTDAQKQVVAALHKLRALRARAAALRTPAAAIKLRSLVLRLFDAQTSLTREVAQLIIFLPSFGAALKPLGPASTKLAAVLSQTSAYGSAAVAAVYAAKAAALRQFQGTVNRVYGRVKSLNPPAVSQPEWFNQLNALGGMSQAAAKLAAELDSGQLSDVQATLTQFDTAASSNRSVAAQKAQIAAVKAYDAAIARLNTLSSQIDAENTRLANQLK
jgi:hypothetical protein